MNVIETSSQLKIEGIKYIWILINMSKLPFIIGIYGTTRNSIPGIIFKIPFTLIIFL